MEIITKTLNVGIGLVATVSDHLCMDKMKETIDELANRGETAQKDARESCQSFRDQRKKDYRHVQEVMTSEVHYWSRADAKYVSRQQYDELVARLETMEASLQS